VGGDKSITHRALLLAALAPGTSHVRGASTAGDCGATLSLLPSLGAAVRTGPEAIAVTGHPREIEGRLGTLECGRSGTTMRLLAGLLAGLPVTASLTGHPQLLRRPMRRVADPLRAMGADVALEDADHAPIRIQGGRLRGRSHLLPVASAQVKSALLLAGLHARGATRVALPTPTRDHTERLLAAMGARIRVTAHGPVSIEPGRLHPIDLDVPGDLSSAAFLLAAAALVPGSDVTVPDVGLNPTRTGFLDLLAAMGAEVTTEVTGANQAGEPVGSVRVRARALRAVRVEADEVPRAVDELPLAALLATAAEGTTAIHGAAELRTKESDRIAGLVAGLRRLGADVEEFRDGFAVTGPTPLRGGRVDAAGDHRLAMTFRVASLVARDEVVVDAGAWVGDSFPGFDAALAALTSLGGAT
jgi:3-phosphoshikimate 1-carboxyvinyltransferase